MLIIICVQHVLVFAVISKFMLFPTGFPSRGTLQHLNHQSSSPLPTTMLLSFMGLLTDQYVYALDHVQMYCNAYLQQFMKGIGYCVLLYILRC